MHEYIQTKEMLTVLEMVNREITGLEHEMSLINHTISETKASNTNTRRWNLTTNEEASLYQEVQSTAHEATIHNLATRETN